MQHMIRHKQQPAWLKHRRLFAFLLVLCLIAALLVASLWQHDKPASNNPGAPLSNTAVPAPGMAITIPAGPGMTGTVPTNPNAVSPLLFGTNLSLFDSNDQVLHSAATRSQLQQMHFRIIRMPVRPNLTDGTEILAAQAIKSTGAYALVVLRGAVDTNVLADDIRIINDMNSIFGRTEVFYEYGNEEDLLGVNVSRYTGSWNAVVPQLKRVALNGQFIGPVNYQYDQAYLTTFLQHANPRPDEVSWHEYTCDDAWSKDACISHIADWTTHINAARGAMRSAIGSALPIMITEWNYAPNATANDGKINDSNFMTTWTTKAIQTLAASRIFASMQYACTNSVYALVSSSNTPTAQGLAMQNLYQSMIINTQQPTPAPTTAAGQVQPTATAAVVPSQYLAFSFEDGGIDGWSGYGKEISLEQNSTDNALDGTHALRVTLTNLASGGIPYVISPTLTSYPHTGQIIDAYVYLPSHSVSFTAKVFVVDNSSRWFASNPISLTLGVWNRLSFTLPPTINGQAHQIGIQFGATTSTPMSSDVYIDAVGWN